MPIYKIVIKKKDKKRGVIKYFASDTLEEMEEYVLQYICDRHDASYNDHFIFGIKPKLDYIINESEHMVAEYIFQLGMYIDKPITYYFDIMIDTSGKKPEGGFLKSNI